MLDLQRVGSTLFDSPLNKVRKDYVCEAEVLKREIG